MAFLQSNCSLDIISVSSMYNRTENYIFGHSYETFITRFDYIFHGLAITFLVIFGLFGNILSLLVLSRPKRWKCINYYLVILAVWDTALLFSSFLLYACGTLIFGKLPVYGSYVKLYPYFYFFSNVASTGSVWVVVMLTVERYVAIANPLKHKTLTSSRFRAKTILTIVSLMAVAFNIPRIFDIENILCADLDGNLLNAVKSTDLYSDFWFHIFYKVVCGILFLSLGPFLVLTTLTIHMFLKLRQATLARRLLSNLSLYRNGDSSNGRRSGAKDYLKVSTSSPVTTTATSRRCDKKQRTSLEYMSLIVVLKFVVCYCLPTVLDLCELFMYREDFSKLTILITLSNVFVVFNSSCNFVIYCVFGKSFRYVMKKFICRSCVSCFGKSFVVRCFPFLNSSLTDGQLVSLSGLSTVNNTKSQTCHSPDGKNSRLDVSAVIKSDISYEVSRDLWV